MTQTSGAWTGTLQAGNGRAIAVSTHRPLVTLTLRAQGVPGSVVQLDKHQLAALIGVLKNALDVLNVLPPIGELSDEDRKKIAMVMTESRGAYDGPRHVDGERIAKAILGEPT